MCRSCRRVGGVRWEQPSARTWTRRTVRQYRQGVTIKDCRQPRSYEIRSFSGSERRWSCCLKECIENSNKRIATIFKRDTLKTCNQCFMKWVVCFPATFGTGRLRIAWQQPADMALQTESRHQDARSTDGAHPTTSWRSTGKMSRCRNKFTTIDGTAVTTTLRLLYSSDSI